MDIDILFNKFREEAENKHHQGSLFERFTKQYLTVSKVYQNIYEKIWLWNDFPYRDGADTGIDLVAKHKYEDKYTAIQCKFFDKDATIHKSDIDSFISCSEKSFIKDGEKFHFSNRLIVTTASKWGSNIKSTLEKQLIPTSYIDFNDFINDEDIDWGNFTNVENIKSIHTKKELRSHQKQAIENILKGFETEDRGKLIMACGTGKTFTSLKLAETFGSGKTILFLAPSISLVSQNIKEWLLETSVTIGCIPVCSDSSVGKKEEDSIGDDLTEFQYTASTNVDSFVKRYKSMPNNVMKVVFSTYQSIDVIYEGQKQCDFEFDLIICDEAHRTTGATLSGKDESSFTKIHNNNFIKGKKRIYMTATPKVFSESIKKKAEDSDVILWSMDDEEVYGREFYRLGFGEAVEENLLSDYKVIILSVSQSYVHRYFQQNIDIEELDDYGKIVGVWNALSKHNLVDITNYTEQNDSEPMKRAVAFTGTIKASEDFKELVNNAHTFFDYEANDLVKLDVDHIDGKMSSIERNNKLSYLKKEPAENTCKILSNARCLSEGIDVPSLDAVVFLSPRSSMVDIVQSVGRVMRKSPNKKYGYIILPIVVPDDVPPEVALNDNKKYSIIWNVLQALRSHDDRFNNIVNSLQFNKGNQNRIVSSHIGNNGNQTTYSPNDLDLEIGFHEALADALYNKIVQKCGDKIYWEKWATEVTDLAKLHIKTINELLESNENTKKAFNSFLYILRANLNNDITQDDAIEMISQHLITKPIFEALFSTYSFVKNNPVSKAIQEVLDNMDDGRLIKGSEKLHKFYDSVKRKVDSIQTVEERQMIIKELYSKFFKLAFKSASEKLGIVYTPVEAVDFIIKAVEYGLNKHFNKSISDKDIHIIDPFTGTGTFITRLLQSGLIKNEDLEYKYKNEIHANELVLLAYYIAAINIEETYHTLSKKEEYTPFEGIVLTDTFQLAETKDTIIDIKEKNFLEENSERLIKQKNAPIKVIIGNPPYSVGQKSENDNNKNTRYEKLEQAISNTYAYHSTATNKNSLYDSYVKAFRWATDRLEDSGIICFITNNGYIDSNAFQGFRKCLSEDFSHIYCFDLKGNIRKFNKDEGENIFGNESMTGVAILLLIKDNSKKEPATVNYSAVPNNLKTKEKLEYIINNSIDTLNWEEIIPDKNNDWLNKRNDDFEKFIPIGDKKANDNKFIFNIYSRGIATSRDNWSYNFSNSSLKSNISCTINYYNSEVNKLENKLIIEKDITTDETKIKWSGTLKQQLKNKIMLEYSGKYTSIASYRPFSKQYFYYYKPLIERTYQMLNIFPTPKHNNIVIANNGTGGSKDFIPFISNNIIDLHILDSGTQCFPLYYYTKYDTENIIEKLNEEVDEYGYKKEYAITDYALEEYQKRYGAEVTKEDIFYYVYGILHNKEYRTKFANDLKKTLARIPFVKTVADFNAYTKAGRELAEVHLNYETIEPYNLDEESKANPSYKVDKMKWNKEKTELQFNNDILFKNIPPRALEYVINGRSPIEWVADQYKISIDKASGIKNDPNLYSTDEKYIYNLVKRVVTVSLKTLYLIDNLPKFDVE